MTGHPHSSPSLVSSEKRRHRRKAASQKPNSKGRNSRDTTASLERSVAQVQAVTACASHEATRPGDVQSDASSASEDDIPRRIFLDQSPKGKSKSSFSNRSQQRVASTARDVRDDLQTFVLGTSADAVRYALRLGRYPLSLVLTCWILYCVSPLLGSLLHTSLVQPFCNRPVVGPLVLRPAGLCDQRPVTNLPDVSKMMSLQKEVADVYGHRTFQDLHALKSSQHELKNLKVLVRVSDIPSKTRFENTISQVIEDAQRVSEESDDLSFKLRKSLNLFAYVDESILREVQKLSASQASSLGAIASSLRLYQNPHRAFLDAFKSAAILMRNQTDGLIAQADLLTSLLKELDGRIETLDEIVQMELMRTESEKVKMNGLLTLLGRNRPEIAMHGRHEALLKRLSSQRDEAQRTVDATLNHLRLISKGMKALGEDLAIPALGLADQFPVDVLKGHVVDMQHGIKVIGELTTQGDQRIKDKQNESRREIRNHPFLSLPESS